MLPFPEVQLAVFQHFCGGVTVAKFVNLSWQSHRAEHSLQLIRISPNLKLYFSCGAHVVGPGLLFPKGIDLIKLQVAASNLSRMITIIFYQE